jgi:hypothetical protein
MRLQNLLTTFKQKFVNQMAFVCAKKMPFRFSGRAGSKTAEKLFFT